MNELSVNIDRNQTRFIPSRIEIDSINGILYEAYVVGNAVKTLNSIPCSICNSYQKQFPERELIRVELPENQAIHFHGSEFNACERKVFLNYINGGNSSFSDSPFLNDGHNHESHILKSIEAGLPDGWKIKLFGNGNERIVDVMGYKLVTHMDSVIMDKDRQVYGIECKAVRDKNFKKYENAEIDPIWYGQIQSYIFSNNIPIFYLIIKSRDTSKIHIPIVVKKDISFIANRLNALKDVADRIIKVKNKTEVEQPNRMYESSKDIHCQFCTFKSVCWKE